MNEKRVYFEPECTNPGCKSTGVHWHGDLFQQYWNGLTEPQREFLRDKAAWEHMSLSAVARGWGAPAEEATR